MPRIAETARLFGDVRIADDALVCDYAVIGHPREVRALDPQLPAIGPTTVEDGGAVFPFAIIYEGTTIGAHSIVEERCKIGYGVQIGRNCRVINGSLIHDRARVGDNCVVGGIVCERARVGNFVTVMGVLLHTHTAPDLPWGVEEPAPVLHDRVVIGQGATVIGDIELGSNVYVAANAVVTKNVPPRHVVVGRNEMIPAEEWRGKGLGESFWNWDESS